MTGSVSTRQEALADIHRALGVFAQRGETSIREARVAVHSARHVAEQACHRYERELEQLRRALNSLGPDDDAGPLLAAIARTEERLHLARSSLATIDNAENRLSAASRRFLAVVTDLTPKARSYLADRSEQLVAYRQAGGGYGLDSGSLSAPGADGSIGAPPSSSSAAKEAEAFTARGLMDFPLDKIDFRDNPVIDGYNRGGATLADYRWAAETWRSVVRPGVLTGMTRDDFASQDATSGARPFRRRADVFDLFLGSDPIRLSPRGNGTYDVIGGRHRVEIARQLGITSLPVSVDL